MHLLYSEYYNTECRLCCEPVYEESVPWTAVTDWSTPCSGSTDHAKHHAKHNLAFEIVGPTNFNLGQTVVAVVNFSSCFVV